MDYYTTQHYTTLHYTTLHYATLRYTTPYNSSTTLVDYLEINTSKSDPSSNGDSAARCSFLNPKKVKFV